MDTPTHPRRHLPPLARPRVSRRPTTDPVCTYIGIHEKTGKRYSVRMTGVAGEVSPTTRRLDVTVEVIDVQSKDPTLQ